MKYVLAAPSPLSPAARHYQSHPNVRANQKMKTSPASCNWKSHIRCLAVAINLRGTDHAYSKTNSQLLASSHLLLVRRPATVVELRLY